MKKNRGERLIKNTIIVALGQICTKFVSFFLLPLYTSLLTTEEYGVVDLLNTCIALLLPLVFFQIDQSLFRYLIDCRDNEKEEKKYISSTAIFFVLQTILYLVVFSILSIFVKNEYKYFLAINVILAEISNILLQITRGLGDNSTYSKGSLISGVSTVAFNVILIAGFKMGAYGMLTATMLGNAFCILYIFIKKKIAKYISIKFVNKDSFKELLKYSIPLIPNQLSWWIITTSDRLIISGILGLGMNGIYSAANKFSGIIVTFYNVFDLTWTESASENFKDSDIAEFFSSMFSKTMQLFSSIIFLTIAIMPFIFEILIRGSDYASAYNQIPILLLSTLFNISAAFLGTIYVAQKKSKEIAKAAIFAAIINIVINLMLIKHIGLYAASFATLIAYLSVTIYRYINLKKDINLKTDKSVFIYGILITLFLLPTYYINNIYLNIISFVIVLIVSILLNRKNITLMVKMAKKIIYKLKKKIAK